MDLDADLDSIFCNLDQPGDAIHHSYPMDIVNNEIFDEDESFVFQSAIFESESKKLIIEKRDVKNKKRKIIQNLTLPICRRPKSLNFTWQPEILFMILLE